jgi:SH3 domain protein
VYVKIASLKFFANPITLFRRLLSNNRAVAETLKFSIRFSRLNLTSKEQTQAMYRFPALLISSFLAANLLVHSNYSAAEDNTRYIRDWISVPLHATVDPDSKVVHNGIVTGSIVTVLSTDETNSYARIRSAGGTEGWIATRYLTAEPTARMQLEKANTELTELRKLQTQLTNLPSDIRAATRQVVDLRGENTRLQAEFEACKNTPTEAAPLLAENSRLKAQVADLQQQLTTRSTELQALQTSTARGQFRDGALAVIGGMLAVVLARRVWPKKRSEWS